MPEVKVSKKSLEVFSEKFPSIAETLKVLSDPITTSANANKYEVAVVTLRKFIEKSPNYPILANNLHVEITGLASKLTTKSTYNLKVENFPNFLASCEAYLQAMRAFEGAMFPRNTPQTNEEMEKMEDLDNW